VRLLGQDPRFENRAHFFGVAAEMIKRVVVDHVRARQAHKRGGGAVRIDLSDVAVAREPKSVDALALAHALEELAALDPEQAHLVELHLCGLTFEEIAEALGISASAAKRSWGSAFSWLKWRLRSRPRRRSAGS
jgi:RNA polymerase sigma factor (TIGR02999 family)